MKTDGCRCEGQPGAGSSTGASPCPDCGPGRRRFPVRRALADALRAFTGDPRFEPRDADLLVQELARLAEDPAADAGWRDRLTTLLLRYERGELGTAAPAAATAAPAAADGATVIPLPVSRTEAEEPASTMDLQADAAGNR